MSQIGVLLRLQKILRSYKDLVVITNKTHLEDSVTMKMCCEFLDVRDAVIILNCHSIKSSVIPTRPPIISSGLGNQLKG